MTARPESLRILTYPHEALRQVAEPIEAVDDQVHSLAHRMIELMHEASGAGLAGPQVGVAWRIFVANPFNEPGEDRVFINPQLRDPSTQTAAATEGCLSLPEIQGEINRHQAITVSALDDQGRAFELTSDELPARVWQHETDHLDGILIIDKMPRLERMSNRRAIRELERAS